MVHTLFFTSPIGLGHASRDIPVAAKLARRLGVEPNEITFVSGMPASRHISESGFHVMDLYDARPMDIEQGEFRRKLRWLMEYVRFYKECKVHAARALEDASPKLIIADEDYAAMVASESSNLPRVLITDFFESHFTSGIGSILERRMNRSLKKIISSAKLVIVPSEGEDHGNTVFVGPIVRDLEKSRDGLRREFGFTKKTVLVTTGGTGAGRFLIEQALSAYREIGQKLDADLAIVSGPSLSFSAEGVRCLGYVRNLHEMIYASDFVISLAGRSTTDEADAYGTPSIFIPIKGHFEQEENAQRYGFVFEDIYRLKELIVEGLDRKRGEVRTKNGAEKACDLILDLL